MLKHSDVGMSLGGFIKCWFSLIVIIESPHESSHNKNQQWHFANFTLGTYLFIKSTLQNCEGQIAILLFC
jgi:hypothetical protein